MMIKRLLKPETIRAARQTAASGSVRQPAAHRPAATLTEILVAILIMSIGVVSVMSLFPIAVLRSAQATTLTNATILKQNAEAFVNSFPQLVHNPDQAIDNTVPDAFGNDQGIREHFSKNYIVDPLGFYLAKADQRLGVLEQNGKRFGGVPACYGNLNDQNARFVWDLCSLPDNWSNVTGGPVDDSLISITTGQVTINQQDQPVLNISFSEMQGVLQDYAPQDLLVHATVDVNEDLNSNGVLDSGEDTNGNQVLDVPFTFSGSVLTVNTNGTVQILLPSQTFNLNNTPVSEVQLEVRERNYTWMLTVRKNAEGEANGNIAVFFKRDFSADDEEIHLAYAYVSDGQGGVQGPVQAQPGITTLRFAPQDNPAQRAAAWAPLVTTGGWMLDVDNMQWYQIKSITSEGGTDPKLQSKPFIEVQLDTPVRRSFSNCMLMRGIVAVFPISTQGL